MKESKENLYLSNIPSLFFNTGPSVLVGTSKDENVEDDCNDNWNKEQEPEFKIGQKSLAQLRLIMKGKIQRLAMCKLPYL